MQGYERQVLIYPRKMLVVEVIVVLVIEVKNIYNHEKKK